MLRNAHARNAPLWLRLKLPDDVVIEFDVWSGNGRGDVKFELCGDGKNHASGYILIQAGWKNTLSVMARLDEHGADRLEKPDRMIANQRYHWKVIKAGPVLDWFIDGQPHLQFHDPEVLRGPGHDRFAFNNWMSDAHYDNLTIRTNP